jgi:CRP-like cAMP-binding protein
MAAGETGAEDGRRSSRRNGDGNGPPGHNCLDCSLRSKPAFKDKPDDELTFIQSMKVAHKQLPAGAEIIFAGEENTELYTLFSGWAFRHKTLADGRRQILHFLLPGDIVGFQAALMDVAEHGIEALTDVELCVFSRKRTWEMFQKMPQLSYELAWLGAREENLLDDTALTLGQRAARERIAALIMGLYRRMEKLGLADDMTFPFPLTRQHMADALGLSLVHTIKSWSWLRGQGYFALANGRLTLLKPRLTERLAQYYESEWKRRPLL